MKKLILLLLFIPLVSFGQNLRSLELNSYKYIVIDQFSYKSDLKAAIKILKNGGYNIVNLNETSRTHYVEPSDLQENPNLALYLSVDADCGASCIAVVSLFDNNNQLIFTSTGRSGFSSSGATKSALRSLANYNYKYDESINKNTTQQLQDYTFDPKSEESIKKWLNDNSSDPIEGIWIWFSEELGNYGRTAIIKNGDVFNEIHLEHLVQFRKRNQRKKGLTYGTFKKMAAKGVYLTNDSGISANSIMKGNTMEVFYPTGKVLAIKEYPNETVLNKKKLKTGEWAGNGSGVIISKSGYIITNHHVIEDADEIEVEFILNDEVQKFNAEIVQVDKTNDLAILKIFDMNFDGVEELPYNFKTRSSDVGTKVYAFGYPMALSIMGKEMKVTDGMISSKTGFDGNITTYQITAPIQGGNSGGPLFDEKGNLIGINSSGIRKDIADNVAYSIKTSYVLNLIDILPKSIELPSNTKLESLPLTEQIKEISKYVVLIKVK